jgi:uncharacterized integral membrane protein
MQFFVWLAFLIIISAAIFAIQNSALPLVTMKFLIWRLETSPVYAMLGSLIAGMLIMLFIWIPPALRASFRRRQLKKEIEVFRRAARGEPEKNERPPE